MSTRIMTTTAAKIPTSIDVIDPCNRTGKITIPMEYVHETRGVHEQHRPRDAKDMSLCLLFQKGSCKAGGRCHQIHADPAFINKLRAQASAGSACCALHGDFHSASYLSIGEKAVEVFTDGIPATYPVRAFGRTSAMDTLIANSPNGSAIRVNSSKVCRLHTQGRCKFGKDCKNVHLCPKAKPCSPVPAPLESFHKLSTPRTKSLSVRLDVTRQELDSICGMSSIGDYTTCEASVRTNSTLSSASASPNDSPKEFGLMNRNIPAVDAVNKKLFATPPPEPIRPAKEAPKDLEIPTGLGFFESLWSMPALNFEPTPSTASAPIALRVAVSDFETEFTKSTTTSAAWR